MRRQYGDYVEFSPDMDETEVMEQLDSTFKTLEDRIKCGIAALGGEPIPDTIERIFKSQHEHFMDRDPLKPDGTMHGATAGVKMWAEIPE